MHWLRERIARSPQAALILGKALVAVGGTLVLAAVFGRAGLISLNADRTQARLAPVTTLAEAFPQYPTWLVPEGPLGYTITAVLVLAGMLLASLAAEALKRRRH